MTFNPTKGPFTTSVYVRGFGRSVPPEVVTEHALGDESQLNLTRALDDGELTRVAVVQLGRVLFHIPGGTEQLHRESGGLHGDLGGVVLTHREHRYVLLGVAALVGQPRAAVRQESGRLDLGGALGDLPLDALELGNRLAERRAVLHVLGRVHEGPFGQTETAGRDD